MQGLEIELYLKFRISRAAVGRMRAEGELVLESAKGSKGLAFYSEREEV